MSKYLKSRHWKNSWRDNIASNWKYIIICPPYFHKFYFLDERSVQIAEIK